MQTTCEVFICTIVAVLIMSRVSQSRSQIGTNQCFLGGQTYRVGDTWHPQLSTLGENSCVNCTCLSGGEVKCVGVDCPKPDCDQPRVVMGQCCPTCDVRMEEDGKDDIELPGCDFYGNQYDNGDMFPSNRTALKPKRDDQCVLCVCYRGEVICHLKTCIPNPRCRKIVKVENDCCPACEEQLEINGNVNYTLGEGDCQSATGRQANGSTWKPVIGQYGEMECIVCTCLNSHVNCSRLQCPDESSLTCESPVLDEDGCCKVCPTKIKKNKKKKGRRRRCKKNSTDEEKKKCRKRRKKSRNKRNKKKKTKDNGKDIFQSTMTIDDVIHRLCMPGKAQRLVYHTKGDDFVSLAFDGPTDNTIEHIQWTIKKNRIQNTERKLVLEPDQFRRNLTVADIMGAVRKKDIKRFMKRLDRKQKKCKKKCRSKLLDRTIKKIKVMDVDLTKSCGV